MKFFICFEWINVYMSISQDYYTELQLFYLVSQEYGNKHNIKQLGYNIYIYMNV